MTACSTGARRPSASRTSWTTRAMVLWAASASTSMSRLPFRLSVPAETRSPSPLARGRDSPVMVASLTSEPPATARPSAGILSPGRTRITSPTASRSTDTVSTPPAAVNRSACSGASSTSDAIERRPRSTAYRSRSSAVEKRKAREAASNGSPISTAATIATDMRKFMSSRSVRTARTPAPKKFTPPMMAAPVRSSPATSSRMASQPGASGALVRSATATPAAHKIRRHVCATGKWRGPGRWTVRAAWRRLASQGPPPRARRW